MIRNVRLGESTDLTDYSGRAFTAPIRKIERSILGLDCTSKIYFHGDDSPYLFDNFQEFETQGMRVIELDGRLAIKMGEKADENF